MATARATRLVPARYLSLYTDYVDSCSKSVLRLQDIWENCGHSEDIVDKKMNSLFRWFGARWQTIIEDELQRLEDLKISIQLIRNELSELYKKLELAEPVQPNGLNLQQQFEWLDKCSKEADRIRSARMLQFKELRRQEQKILILMSDQQVWQGSIDYSAEANDKIPTESELALLSVHVASLRKEREVRLENLRPVIGEAREVMDRIGKVPNVAIEESLQSLSPELWDLSKANIELAGDMLDALRIEEMELCARHRLLLQQLQRIFNRLDVDSVEREKLLGRLRSTKTYQAVSRLEELEKEYKLLAKANLPQFIERLKYETKKCYEDLRAESGWRLPLDLEKLSDQGPSEKLAEAYEKHIDDLKSRHRSLIPLFKLFDDWQQMKEDYRQLEEAQKDPQRFKNRGGALLQETKKRDRLKKHLPLIMNQIMKFLDAYEADHGPVYVHGKMLREILNTDQRSGNSRSRSNSTNSGDARTPHKPVRSIPTASGSKTSKLRRAGTAFELKSSSGVKAGAGSVRQPDRTNHLVNAYANNGKIPTKSSENVNPVRNKDTSLKKRTLRRSLSYDGFKGNLSSNDLQSTRVANSGIATQASKCRLIF
ncbi:protein regulator of cytokinesis 1-like isoform X2 [Varroa destructor]|uniref:Protein regulator of cytokinesis 1 n=1 Tax=Varroa destructor TaxID=109461 RepID=A0A7M7IX09_VARDE|nr:protein regulator of cytokinesis 1-like isoform X2 [Varroa destructor]